MLNLRKGMILKHKNYVQKPIINMLETIKILDLIYMENGTINYVNVQVIESNYRRLGLYSWNQYYISTNYTMDFDSELDRL